MLIDTLIVGLAALGLGALFTFAGFKAFFFLLPVIGFATGMLIGASLIMEIFGDGLFRTLLSLAGGVALGIVFAVLSFFFYYGAIILLGGIVGWTLGTGLMAFFGIDSGLLSFVVGAGVGIVFAVGVLVLNAPALLVILLSSIGGGVYVAAGAFILLGQITVDQMGRGGAVANVLNHPLAVILWVVVAVIGVGYQYQSMGRTMASIDRARYMFN